jgi:putative holliday junction resolvase
MCGPTMSGRIMAVDPGEKRHGIAISDPTGMIANPLTVLKHVSRKADAAIIGEIARQNEAVCIVIGQAFELDGTPGPMGRQAARLAEVLRDLTDTPVVLWDESGSTKAARSARLAMGASKAKRRGHLDELAATYILQSYLDNLDQNKRSV